MFKVTQVETKGLMLLFWSALIVDARMAKNMGTLVFWRIKNT